MMQIVLVRGACSQVPKANFSAVHLQPSVALPPFRTTNISCDMPNDLQILDGGWMTLFVYVCYVWTEHGSHLWFGLAPCGNG